MYKSILIVEDETRIRFLLKDYFAKEKNFNIYEAENGLEALNIFKEKKIDLIILVDCKTNFKNWTKLLIKAKYRK